MPLLTMNSLVRNRNRSYTQGMMFSDLARVFTLITMLLVTAPARATEVSHWDGDARSAVRLMAGAQNRDSGEWRAAVELRLKPGWITYWRYPGDAGVPPRFDFSGSTNVKSAQVLWPAPKRIAKGGVESIGYESDVAFPIHIVAQDAAKPVILRLKMDYGVCENLCVPAEAKVDLPLNSDTRGDDAAIKIADGKVPTKKTLGPSDGLAITKIKRDGHRVIVTVVPDGDGTDVFVEGPTPDWAFPLPKRQGADFILHLDGAPAGASYAGVDIKLTAISGGDAIEVVAKLD